MSSTPTMVPALLPGKRGQHGGQLLFGKGDARHRASRRVRAYKRTSAPRVASISAMRRPSVPAPRMAIGAGGRCSLGVLNVMAMPRGLLGGGFLPQVFETCFDSTRSKKWKDSISALSVVWTIIGAIAR